ncbi:sensor domain-containing diguanylate cyclase [bacterium]|nr:sensor domain-containing diguanylate cyclase [candidate division CSSED10-310 bacterium]
MKRSYSYRLLFPEARAGAMNIQLAQFFGQVGIRVVTTLRTAEPPDAVLAWFHGRSRVSPSVVTEIRRVSCPVIGIEREEEGDRNDPITALDYQLNYDTPPTVIAHTIRTFVEIANQRSAVQALDQTKRHLRQRLDDVVNLGIQLTGTLMSNELFEGVVERAAHLVPGDLHDVFTIDTTTKLCRSRARQNGASRNCQKIPPTHRLHPQVEAALIEASEPVQSTSPFTSPSWMQYLTNHLEPMAAIIVAPFLHKDHLIGFLVIGRRNEAAVFTPEEAERIEVLSAFSSVAIENAVVYEQMDLASRIDDLTRVSNFKTINSFLDRLITAQDTFTLVFLDLDGFKKINLVHGHTAGNRALRAAAARISDIINPLSMVGRFGGDEFVIVMPGTTAVNARQITAEVIRSIERIKHNKDIRLSASAGIAEYPYDGTDLNSLIHAADTAMYGAKDRGKGHVIMYRELSEESL